MRRRPLLAVAFAMAVLAVIVPTVSGPANAAETGSGRTHDFPDVADDNPFHESISWMVDQGFIGGYADGTFRPTAPMSRQAVVQMLWVMSDSPAGPFADETYSDIAPSHPFITAIEWAASVDAMGGYADGTFRPTAPVTRQAFGAILHRLSGIHREYGHPDFPDVPESHVFADDIWWWTGSGQADGYPDGTFKPEAALTRQAAAAFLARFYDMMGGYWPYTDHHSHVCDDPPTPEQEAKADLIIDDVEELISTTYPTKGAALAAGYRVTAPPAGGEGSHLVNDDFTSDGLNVDDPDEYAEAVLKPESLVVNNTGFGGENNSTPIAAAMYVREYVGPGPSWPPEPVGCVGTWHAHDNLCYSGSLLEESSVVWLATFEGGCIGNSMVRITPEMFHVWRDAYWDGGPFDGIET
jgi:hypothetical protein